MKLYNYWRSSSSWRVRIALALKGLPYEYVAVNLLEGEQHQAEHRARNPSGTLPLLELDDGRRVAQSVAILELLEELHPTPPLLPRDPVARAQVRMLAEVINSGTQPYQNTGTMAYVREVLKGDDKAFTRHFVELGLSNLQALAAPLRGRYLVGDSVTLADCFLIPQLFGARRFGVEVSAYPALLEIEAECLKLPAFVQAAADRQPDAQP